MKTWIVVLMVMVMALMVSVANAEPVKFAWDQPVITDDFGGWILYKSEAEGGPYAELTVIPYSGIPQGTYEQVVTIPAVTGNTMFYFVVTAHDTLHFL